MRCPVLELYCEVGLYGSHAQYVSNICRTRVSSGEASVDHELLERWLSGRLESEDVFSLVFETGLSQNLDLSRPATPPAPLLLCCRYRYAPHLGFYMGAGNLNSVSRACVACMLHVETFPKMTVCQGLLLPFFGTRFYVLDTVEYLKVSERWHRDGKYCLKTYKLYWAKMALEKSLSSL